MKSISTGRAPGFEVFAAGLVVVWGRQFGCKYTGPTLINEVWRRDPKASAWQAIVAAFHQSPGCAEDGGCGGRSGGERGGQFGTG